MPVPVAGPGPRQLGGLELKVVSLAWPGTLARGLRWRWQREAGAAELAGGPSSPVPCAPAGPGARGRGPTRAAAAAGPHRQPVTVRSRCQWPRAPHECLL